MTILFMEPGCDWGGTNLHAGNTVATPFYDDWVGGSSTAQARTGTRSFLSDGSGGYFGKFGVAADAGRRVCFAVRFDAFPTAATCKIFQITQTSASNEVFSLAFRSGTSKLRVIANATNNDGTGDNFALSTGVWYQIAVAYTITLAAVNEIRVYVNNVLTHSLTNTLLANTSSNRMYWGAPGGSSTNSTYYTDDIYVDDSTALTNPGEIHIAQRYYNALSTNGFDTLAPASGETNRWDRLTDWLPDDTRYIQQAATGAQTETYLTAAASGTEIGATVLGWCAWVRARNGSGSGSGTARTIVSNGVDSSQVMTTSFVDYAVITSGSTWPTGPWGMKHPGTAADTYFAEGGVCVAYIPAATVWNRRRPSAAVFNDPAMI